MSKKFDVATLAAYAAGELRQPEHAEVKALLKRDPQARRTLNDLQDGAEIVREAYGDPAFLKVPAALQDSVESMLSAASPPPSKVMAGPESGWRSWFGLPQLSAALALTLVAAFCGYFVAELRFDQKLGELTFVRSEDRAHLEKAIAEALESRPSGQAVEWRNPNSGTGGEVVPLRTFKTRHGQWCREFRETVFQNGIQEERHGIACREASGGWETQVITLGDS